MTARVPIGDYVPWPFVGVTVLLVVFILVTPVLLSTSGGPGLLTEAELVVDHEVGQSVMHFYVRAVGETVRYTLVRVGVATGFGWTGRSGVPWTTLDWSNWTNTSDVLVAVAVSTANPVALNITVYYTSAGGNAEYGGTIAFYVAGMTTSSQTMYFATPTSGLTVPTPLAVSNATFPLPIRLATVGGGP